MVLFISIRAITLQILLVSFLVLAAVIFLRTSVLLKLSSSNLYQLKLSAAEICGSHTHDVHFSFLRFFLVQLTAVTAERITQFLLYRVLTFHPFEVPFNFFVQGISIAKEVLSNFLCGFRIISFRTALFHSQQLIQTKIYLQN